MTDRMSAEEWSSVWTSRETLTQVKERIKSVALRELTLLIREWIRGCGAGKNPEVTEIGCAPGVMLARIHRACSAAKIRGIDYSEAGLQATRCRLERLGIQAELTQADLFTDTPSAQCDLAVSFGLIEHFSDPEEVLRQHKKYVKPGGTVAVSVPNFTHPFVQRCLRKYRPRDLETHELGIMSQDGLREAFEKAGYKSVTTGTALGPLIPAPVSFQRGELVYGVLSAGWNTVSGIIPASLFWPGIYWAKGNVS